MKYPIYEDKKGDKVAVFDTGDKDNSMTVFFWDYMLTPTSIPSKEFFQKYKFTGVEKAVS
jgi:hypothetical protein